MTSRQLARVSDVKDKGRFDFGGFLRSQCLQAQPLSIDTLQVNITRRCNQACRHCHVNASPLRREEMELHTIDQCLTVLRTNQQIKNLDLTGGAPELHPHFEYFVRAARELNKHVMVRHNLTIQFDGDARAGISKEHLPDFFAEQQIEVVCSLPYYQEYFTDRQRGSGVFSKSIQGLQRLNAAGYGQEDCALALDLVYNPAGTFLPAPQAQLEQKFKAELQAQFGIVFNRLFTITNMPINRFREELERLGTYEEYLQRLERAFNPAAVDGLMCRSMISIGWDGRLYDCDFNQMLELPAAAPKPLTIFDFDYEQLLKRRIAFAAHCFGCTAGCGSSCGGQTA